MTADGADTVATAPGGAPGAADPVPAGGAGAEVAGTGVDDAVTVDDAGAGEVVGEPAEVDGAVTGDDELVGEPAEVTPPAGPPVEEGRYRMALVSTVTLDLPAQHPTVLLRETESPRRSLTFQVALPDAVALAHAHRRMATPRPLTGELVASILQAQHVDVVAVRLVGRRGSVYFAELDLQGRAGRTVHSCRPSDALTIALHQPVPVPILIDVRLLEEAGDVEPEPAD